jgi:hypothetical protein
LESFGSLNPAPKYQFLPLNNDPYLEADNPLSTPRFEIIFYLYFVQIPYKNIQHLYRMYIESIQKVKARYIEDLALNGFGKGEKDLLFGEFKLSFFLP